MHKEEKQPAKKTNRWIFAGYIGFFAGLIWGGLKLLEHSLKFTSIVPGFLIEPFFIHSFLGTWIGYFLGWGSFILFSIFASYVYMVVLSKAKGPWPGIGYGIGWWGVLYLLLGPITGMVPHLDRMDLNSILTDLCLFVLWGLFIGYSITYEFTDERNREPAFGGVHPQK